jgi:hypothetical protein
MWEMLVLLLSLLLPPVVLRRCTQTKTEVDKCPDLNWIVPVNLVEHIFAGNEKLERPPK